MKICKEKKEVYFMLNYAEEVKRSSDEMHICYTNFAGLDWKFRILRIKSHILKTSDTAVFASQHKC